MGHLFCSFVQCVYFHYNLSASPGIYSEWGAHTLWWLLLLTVCLSLFISLFTCMCVSTFQCIYQSLLLPKPVDFTLFQYICRVNITAFYWRALMQNLQEHKHQQQHQQTVFNIYRRHIFFFFKYVFVLNENKSNQSWPGRSDMCIYMRSELISNRR